MGTAVAEQAATSTAVQRLDVRNLTVERVIAHRIYERAADKSIREPKTSNKLIKLIAEGREAIQKRITSAIGSRTHGVEMSIERVDVDSYFQLAADLIHAQEAQFVDGSKDFAQQLTQSQGTTNAPAGMLAVVSGKVGADPKRYIAVIKADVHDGFGAIESNEDVDMQYLTSLLLTESQKLYKVGLLLELDSGPRLKVGDYVASNYRAFLFDHLITGTETRSAAAYFYSAFLGMGIQKSSKKLTQDFFEHTQNFIKTSAIDSGKKSELKEALRVEMRSSNGVIVASEFARTHFPKEMQAPYRLYLEEKKYPKNAVVKDTEYVKARLRKPRKMLFASGVQIVVPSDLSATAIQVIEKTPEHATVRIQGSYTEVE